MVLQLAISSGFSVDYFHSNRCSLHSASSLLSAQCQCRCYFPISPTGPSYTQPAPYSELEKILVCLPSPVCSIHSAGSCSEPVQMLVLSLVCLPSPVCCIYSESSCSEPVQMLVLSPPPSAAYTICLTFYASISSTEKGVLLNSGGFVADPLHLFQSGLRTYLCSYGNVHPSISAHINLDEFLVINESSQDAKRWRI